MEFILNQKKIGTDLEVITSICQRAQLNSSANLCLVSLKQKDAKHYLSLTATDFDFVYQKETEVEGKGEGELCVSPVKLGKFISALSGHDIEFKAFSNQPNAQKLTGLHALAEGYAAEILGTDRDQFPSIVQEEIPFRFTISGKDWREIFSAVDFCIQNTNIRRNLLGMNVHHYKGAWYFTGSDSHRISFIRQNFKAGSEEEGSFLVPKKALAEISKIVGDKDQAGAIDVHFNSKQLFIKTAERQFRCLLMSDEFPNVTNFYSLDNPETLTLDKDELASILKVFHSYMDRDQNPILLEVSRQNLNLTSKGTQGSIVKKMPVAFSGEGLTLSFNLQYLIDAVGSFDQKEPIEMKIKDSISPVVFVQSDKPNYRHILMPLRV